MTATSITVPVVKLGEGLFPRNSDEVFNLDQMGIARDRFTKRWYILSPFPKQSICFNDKTIKANRDNLFICQDNVELDKLIRQFASNHAETGSSFNLAIHVLDGVQTNRTLIETAGAPVFDLQFLHHVVWHPDEGDLKLDSVSHVHVIPESNHVSKGQNLVVNLNSSFNWDEIGKLIKKDYRAWSRVKQFIYCMIHHDPSLIFSNLHISRSIAAMECYAKETSKSDLVQELIRYYESLGLQFKYSTKTGWEIDSNG